MIIITGAAGFIGSAIVGLLNSMGLENLMLVDAVPEQDKKLNICSKRYAEFIPVDKFLDMLEKDGRKLGVKTIFHMGACADTTESDEDFLEENNFIYSKRIAEWSLKNKARLIYASSAATYGSGEFGYSDENENSLRLAPLNPYGRSKQKFDLWTINNKLDNKIVGLKFFNVFGPNEYHKGEMKSLVAKAYSQIKETGKIRLFKSYKPEYADGEQVRDFVYIKDVLKVIKFFFENKNIGGIYNVGTGRSRSWNSLAKAIFAALNQPVNIEYIDMPEYIKDKYQYHTQADLTKLREAGYKEPFMKLEDSVADYVKNHLEKGFVCL